MNIVEAQQRQQTKTTTTTTTTTTIGGNDVRNYEWIGPIGF